MAGILKRIRRAIPEKRTLKGCDYPVYLRPDTSDAAVFEQVFNNDEYSPLGDVDEVKFILDCGGYTGLSAIWFLNRYPSAQIAVLEPDKRNFAMCRKNLRPYKARAVLFNMAIWSEDGRLVKDHNKFRDGRDWAARFRPPRTGEPPDVAAIGMKSLAGKFGNRVIDILKIDIEESERELFSGDCGWLSSVRNIAIELHDESLRRIFLTALSGYKYKLYESGDLTICKGINR